ncbi:MAG: hypothetical protein Q4B58_07250, partial [Bacteroidales bacterium]|nr:hypothetical protein [Bacteroidales bacterium]
AHVEGRGDKSVLFFTQAYPWEHEDVIDDVLEQLGEPEPNIYMLAECFEDGVHWTNDREGKYFPERYRVLTDIDDDDVYFVTREEAIAHFHKAYPELPADMNDIEQICKICDENDQYCGFNEIKVY